MNEEILHGVDFPIFCENWDDESETNHLILIGGMATYDKERMAIAYKAAGDMLIEYALASGDRSWEVTAPVLFLYRHTVELYLKWVVYDSENNHNIAKLVEEADQIAMRKVGKNLPDWVKARLLEFAYHDPHSTKFRYAPKSKQPLHKEYGIDLYHLRRLIEVLTDGLAKLARL